MRVVVLEIVNGREKHSVEAQKLHDLIVPVLARGEEVELDFEGVRFISAPFLTISIGQLLKDHPLGRLKSLLRVEHLHPVYADLLESVIERSSRYYTEPRYREAVDRSLAKMFEDQ